MREQVKALEAHRLVMQNRLDAEKNAVERNRMGQFATPTALATDILGYAKAYIGQNDVRFIDPAIGTGAFYSALLNLTSREQIKSAVGYEIDPHYGASALSLWADSGLDVRVGDFTQAEAPEGNEKFNLLICNPPYVRHHHIANSEKQRLKLRMQKTCGIDMNGLAGLYCYFMGLSHAWLREGGLAGWLVPSEFMDVNYGAALKRYLLDKVTLFHIHRFDPNDVQFTDALVSSAIVWFRKAAPPTGHSVRFTYGGSLQQPHVDRLLPVETLRSSPKWTRYPRKKKYEATDEPVLGGVFNIKRGLATGDNKYFILSDEEIYRRGLPMAAFKPILPSPRYLQDDEVKATEEGRPILDRRLFLLAPPWPEGVIRERYPKLWMYLEEGKARGVAQRYLCQHRKPWYTQENRSPAPFACTYMGRNGKDNKRPFRFILNHSQATAANVYLLLYPREPIKRAVNNNPDVRRQVWKYLNEISAEEMLGESRVYGGGLHKLEPRELANVSAGFMRGLFPSINVPRKATQLGLFTAV